MPVYHQIQDIFGSIPEYFLPDAAQNTDFSVQVNLSGEDGGSWQVEIHAGELNVHKREHPDPDLTIFASDQDCLAIANGKLNPLVAYMQGRIHVHGDTTRITELRKIFRLPEELEWLRSIQ